MAPPKVEESQTPPAKKSSTTEPPASTPPVASPPPPGGVEPKTGITFPGEVNNQPFLGAGVRYKFGVAKIYAVGVYSSDKSELLDPSTSKTIRVVMARSVGQAKFFAGLREGVEPRMKGRDLSKVDEFIELNPPGDFNAGGEDRRGAKRQVTRARSRALLFTMYTSPLLQLASLVADVVTMALSGGTMHYTSSRGADGKIESATFVNAMADLYLGEDPVAPTLKEALK